MPPSAPSTSSTLTSDRNTPSPVAIAAQIAGMNLSENEDISSIQGEQGRAPDPPNAENLPPKDSLYSGSDTTLAALAHVLSDPRKRRALRELSGGPAQLLIDFMYSIVIPPESVTSLLHASIVVTLYKLAKGANLYPQCYVIKDITPVLAEDGLLLPRGGGRMGDIFKGLHNGHYICLKFIRLFKKRDLEAAVKVFAKEAILWSQLRHPNIVPFYGTYYANEGRSRICLISPWMENGNVVQYLENNPDVPRPSLIRDVASGLEYLHKSDIIHSDLKGENILVTGSGRACIGDFGMSAVRHDKVLSVTVTKIVAGFTYRWAAPELLNQDKPATWASDVWAFASVCYEILTRKKPYHECEEESNIKEKIQAGESPTRPPGDATSDLDVIDDKMWDLMSRCWSHEDYKRPNSQQILEELGSLPSTSLADDMNDFSEAMKFQAAMRSGEGIEIDTSKVEEILHAVRHRDIQDILEGS